MSRARLEQKKQQAKGGQNDIFYPMRIESGSTEMLRKQLQGFAEFLRSLEERLRAKPHPDQMVVMLANLALQECDRNGMESPPGWRHEAQIAGPRGICTS